MRVPHICLGTLAGKFSGGKYRHWRLGRCRAIVAELERAGSWDGPDQNCRPPTFLSQPERITIERAVQIYLDELERTITTGTYRKPGICLNDFRDFPMPRVMPSSTSG